MIVEAEAIFIVGVFGFLMLLGHFLRSNDGKESGGCEQGLFKTCPFVCSLLITNQRQAEKFLCISLALNCLESFAECIVA